MQPPSDGPFRVLVEDATADREHWLELRKKVGISASKVPAVVGVSPFESPLSAWAWYRGMLPDQEETPQMRWGTKLQNLVASTVAEDEGLVYFDDERLVQSTENELVLATPDGWFALPDGTLQLAEVKTTKNRSFWEDEIPKYVQAQCQAQMYALGKDRVRVAVYFREESDHFWDFIERDDAWINNIMLPSMEDFWKMVQENVAPEADGLERTAEAIRAAWPEATEGLKIELPEDFSELDLRLQEVKAQEKELKAEKRELENKLKAKMGEAQRATIPGHTHGYSYNTQRREAYTVEAQSYRVLRRFKQKGT